MAATNSSTTGSTTTTTGQQFPSKPIPAWQMDLLMEKLRQKSGTLKPLPETAKNVRIALLERRSILDQGDKLHLQKCLDVLQQSVKINSLQSMVERLEMISRQEGLKFHPGGTGNEWFISSDMFYLELLIDPNGVVQEVKIQHDGKAEQQSCPEITESLQKNNFADFTTHLEGLVSIYQLNADKKIKSKAFIALQALEADLSSMFSTYSHITDGEIIIMKSLLGLIQPRKGGHPVRLTFYISPYEFLDVASKTSIPFDTATISERKLGVSGTISIQPFSSYKLQMNTTVTVVRLPDGKSVPRYGVLNATNSTALPACFCINLKVGVPMCKELVEAIHSSTGIQSIDCTGAQPILNLITQHTSKGALDCSDNNGLSVTLPDQIHNYFMTQTQNLEGVLVSSISFTLASQLPPVINILRQQLAFNTLVASCVRVESKPEEDCIVFEVNALSHQNLAISFQHPLEDSLVTLEFDLKDVSHPQCHLHAVTNVADIIPTLEEHACKVVQRSMSIPITVRAIIRRWQSLKSKYEPPNPDYSIPVGSSLGSDSKTHPNADMSCGTESERAQQQNQQQTNQQVPGMVMSLVGSSTSNVSISPSKNYKAQHGPGQRTGNQPAYTISPIATPNTSASSTGQMNFQMPQNPSVDLLSSYMNPLFSMNFQNLSGLTLQNLQNLQNFPPNMNMSPAKMALQMNLLATQLQNQQQQGNQAQGAASQKSSALLMGLMDQVGQRGKRRKRKGMSSDSVSPVGNTNMGTGVSMPRPSPSPSPKSGNLAQRLSVSSSGKSPKRRPSECSDISESNDGNSRSTTPHTPTNSAIGLLMSELGFDNPDPRWNIDITPVTSSGGSSIPTSSMETFIASKLLSNFGNTAAGNLDFPNVDSFLQNLGDADIEIDTTGASTSDFPSSKFSLPKKAGVPRRPRDFPKRSMSLDSSQLGLGHGHTLGFGQGMDMDPGSAANLQNLMHHQDTSAGVDSNFKPLVTPSLSITPVSTNSSLGNSAVNSLLANIRPGIEIIPLPNPVTIPNSITVTPILPKGTVPGSPGAADKKPVLIKTEEGMDTSFGPRKKSVEKKERKRKVGVIADADKEFGGTGGKQLKLMSGYGSVGSNPSTALSMNLKQNTGPAATGKPHFGLQLKKQSSPASLLNRPPTLKTSGSPTPKIGVSQGKPSVSTLKSVSVSPSGATGAFGSATKTKIIKDKSKLGGASGSVNFPKLSKNLPGFGGANLGGLVPPTLKPMGSISDSQLSGNIATGMNMLLSGMQAGIKAEQQQQALTAAQQSSAATAAILAKGVLDMTKAQLVSNAGTTVMSIIGQNQAGKPGSGGVALGSNPLAAKKGGLAAVIDKLKSQYSGEAEIPGAGNGNGNGNSKKDMSKQDYIKASSTITSELQKTKSGSTVGAGGSSQAAPGPGGNTGAGGSQEYIVKPGGQGLKLTLNKTKGLASSGKDKLKAGVKAPAQGIKRPLLHGGVKAPAGSASPFPPKGISVTKKKLEKDSSPSSTSSSSTKQAQQGLKGQTPLAASQAKPKADEENDLTKKLFMPGAVRNLESGVFDGPKFDSKFQIPKKSRTVASTTPATTPTGTPPPVPEKNELVKEKAVETLPSSGSEKPKATTPVESPAAPIAEASEQKPTDSISVTPEQARILKSLEFELRDFTSGNDTPPQSQAQRVVSPFDSFAMNLSLSSNTFPSARQPPQLEENIPDDLSHKPSFQSQNESSEPEMPELTSATALDRKSSPVQRAETSFVSPESPDPISRVEDDAVYKTPPTIPTTPQRERVAPPPPIIGPSAIEAQSPASPEDDDHLIMDIPSDNSSSSFKIAESASASVEPSPRGVDMIEETAKDLSTTSAAIAAMPPPPPPPVMDALALLSASINSPVPSPSSTAAAIANLVGPLTPVVSVHIVHSPQPNSPALLRSPMMAVPSPHSSLASPYTALDDDLMDEAVIGAGN